MYRDFMSTYDIFKNNGSCDPLLDTLRLFDLLTNGKTKEALSLPVKEIVDVKKIAHERQKGLPMEYILGRATFMGRSFYCSRGALIPTEETSLLVMTAYNIINTDKEVIENKNNSTPQKFKRNNKVIDNKHKRNTKRNKTDSTYRQSEFSSDSLYTP